MAVTVSIPISEMKKTTLEDVVKPPQGLITNMVAAIDFEQIKQIKRQGLNT